MHHLSTVNLDTLSEFITTGVSFFLFLFVFSWRLQAQCRCTGPRPNQTPCMFPPPPGEWRAACFAGSSPVGGSVSWFLNSASFFVSLFKQDLLRFPNFILMSSPWSPLSLCGLCIWLCRRYSRGHWWFAFKMMWFVQIIFHLYYWDGSISFFFPWWFEVVRVVSYCLIKFSDPKKKKKKPSVPCVPNSGVVLSHLRRNQFSLLAWPRMTAAPIWLLGYRHLLRDTWALYYHCSFWEVPGHAVFLLSWVEFLFLFAFVKTTNSGCFC